MSVVISSEQSASLDSPQESTIIQPQEPAVEERTEEWDYIDRLERKPKEHIRTWNSRLHQRWYEITSEKIYLPVTEKACKLFHHELIQIDEEAYEKIRKKQIPLRPSESANISLEQSHEPSSLTVDELAKWLAGPEHPVVAQRNTRFGTLPVIHNISTLIIYMQSGSALLSGELSTLLHKFRCLTELCLHRDYSFWSNIDWVIRVSEFIGKEVID